ncbi:MAG TPA: pantoate--beta-alanine ligase [Actinophytocola sp.]|jgi:pantoate--beta-alanine ligase|nr:pantoate--beta-alanine ligase [Actinophytocola sp.]
MTAPRFTPGQLNVHSGLDDVVKISRALRGTGRRIALVPTMGALHDGHRQLMRTARRLPNAVLTTSIFVNPLQFGPGEDFERYPRTLDADLDICRTERVELVFTPERAAMYHDDAYTTVHPGPLGDELEGAARPGHFAGVLTVVAKLFNLVRPDFAVFGEKDYQQLVLVRRMVRDLNLDVKVIGVPIVREGDGLARSSRNVYLEPGQRAAAVALSAALTAGARISAEGPGAVLDAARGVLAKEPGLDVDYLELRARDLGPVPPGGEARLLVAARVGTTRLLDNVPVFLGEPR